jgi:hypothetical protein
MSRDDDGDGGSHWEQEAVAAAEAYILLPPLGTGNLLIDVDEEEQNKEPLPVLSSIWECPMINKFDGFDDNGKPFSGWTVAGAPSKKMARHQNPIGR